MLKTNPAFKNGAVFLGVVLGMCLTVTSFANTLRVYGATGEGYTDITTNDQGDEIRKTKYNENGTVERHTERDPKSGSTETTEYEEGKPKTRTTKDGEGRTREEVAYDSQGRVSERETTDDDFNTEKKRYHYDEKGRVKQTDTIGGGGGIEEVIEFDYDEQGKLKKATRWRDDASGTLKHDGSVEFDGDGNVVGREGNTDGLLEEVQENIRQEFGDENTHVTRDPNGNTVIVRHNADGSYDVTVIDREGRVISRQYLSSGRCYLGDECPFRQTKPALNTVPVTHQTAPIAIYPKAQKSKSPVRQPIEMH